ncbi:MULTISPECIES: hypothetical protein [unclassified Maridesulfovibrio]|uniref:hypothetical protein n=1 Tax=unclassified Maridesulfovibrio TaxID=2794999 RepID=UPI003B3DD619
MTTFELLAEAIQNKKQVHALYKGHKRELCPHVLGEKNGITKCLFYQFGGESSSRPIVPGSTQNWRCLNIELLDDVEIIDGDWFTADNHSRTQTCVGEVLEIVDYD